MKQFIILLALTFSFATLKCFAQNNNSKTDSLQLICEKENNDSLTLICLIDFAWEQMYVNADYAIYLANEALKIAETKKLFVATGIAKNTMGVIFWNQDNYPKALSCFQEALKIYEKYNRNFFGYHETLLNQATCTLKRKETWILI